MRKLLAFFVVLLITQAALSQSSKLKGKIVDTLDRKNLENAVISLLNKKDSTLAKFTRSNKTGTFQLENIAPGNYVLLISYPKFADYEDEVEVKNQPETDLGTIALTLKSKLMEAIVIKSSGPIRIKGDTTEFVADSFHVREGATVEDLLKKFPGFQVNSKGEITAQGKRVDKVLVDGEEFFGDDPTMATQNLSSKAVDKVQLFDTKTDQQNLTGISTGESNTKTLNIKLKSDYKKGSFGRIEGATDFDKFHDAKVLYNNFKGSQKFSLYGTKSTTTTGSLSWQDQNKFGVGNDDIQYDDVSGSYYSFGQDDEFNNWNLHGLPNAYVAGGAYINKWDNDRQGINTSMKYNYLGTVNESSLFTKTILPDSVLISQKNTNGHGVLQQYAPTIKYDWKPDSVTTISFKSSNSYKTNNLTNYTNSETDLGDLTPLNKSNRINNNDGTKRNSDNFLSYKRLLKKPGDQITASIRYTYSDDDEDNFINTRDYYYSGGSLFSQDSINQEKKIHSQSSVISGNVSWTKTLNKDWSVVTLGSYSQNNATGHLNTYDKSINGTYEDFSPFYSNNFTYLANATGGTAVIKYVTKKINFLAGTGISDLKQQVNNLDSNTQHHYTFLKVLPQMQLRYTFKPQTGIYFNYRGASQQPTIDQLQPLRNNSDPLNINIGNPNLKIGFNHNFRLTYNSFRTLSQRYFYVGLNYTMYTNAVTTYSTIDNLGRRISSNVNTNGNNNWNAYLNWFKSLGDGKWNYGAYGNINGGTSITFINGQKSVNHYYQYTANLNLGKSKEGKYDFNISPHFGQNFSSSSLQPNNKTHYISWGSYGNITVTVLKKFEISSDLDAQLRQKINAADINTNVILWNAQLTRKLFKKDVARISFIAHDILNQNKGTTQSISSNFITNERYLQVPRYFQLKFEWSFNNNPGAK